MFNRFKNILEPSLKLFQAKHQNNKTLLYHLLPTFTSQNQFYDYVKAHGKEKVMRELNTVTAEGYTPTSLLRPDSPVLEACLAFMDPTEGILPLNEPANFAPNPNKTYQADYKELYDASNYVINTTRWAVLKSPYSPYFYSSDFPPKLADYHEKDTTKIFAHVGLDKFMKHNRLGQLEAAVYQELNSGYHLLIINNILHPRHAVFCCPWKGVVLPTSEAEAKLRIPTMHKISERTETHMLYYNPEYHKLKPLRAPVHAGSLAPKSAALDPIQFFKQAASKLRLLSDSRHLGEIEANQALRKPR